MRIDGGRGAVISITWAEALVDADGSKSQRDRVDQQQIVGRTTRLYPNGGRLDYQPLWWTSGRYREICIVTADQSLTLHEAGVIETRYPLEMRATHSLFPQLTPILFRTLQCCAHETYVDCPYYEQLQYTGDTRLQALANCVCDGDDRLAQQALRNLGKGLAGDGMLPSRYPSRSPQCIPQFALYWVAMLHDFLMWRAADSPRLDLVAQLLPTARGVVEQFLARRRHDELYTWPEGLDFVDWVEGWEHGRSPDPCVNLWQLVYTFGLAASLEDYVGEALLAERLRQRQSDLARVCEARFWDPALGCWRGAQRPTQHAQCFAILSGAADPDHCHQASPWLTSDQADPATFYFQHYVFEALHTLGRDDQILLQLKPWHQMLDAGFKTTPERPDPCRSDCHAWSAHPLFHLHASLGGIRPTAPGMQRLKVRPTIDHLHLTCMHPQGKVALRFNAGQLQFDVPDGVEVEH